MKIIPFSEIKNELISNMQRGLLIPIIGSGFTRNCSSFRGKVPSGNDYRRYMIGRILEAEPSLSVEKERLEKETFSNISSMYHKVVPNEAQEQYLWNNFTRVAIEDKKKDLLSLPWPYISLYKLSRFHPHINFADFEFPKTPYLGCRHITFLNPVENRIAADPKVFRNFFHRVPTFDIYIHEIPSLSNGYIIP